jgi:hypothetical protein
MADKPEALLQRLERLGQDSVGSYGMPICAEAAAELRRLVAENERLKAEVLMEREACAKVCEDASKPREGEMHSDAQWAGLILSAAIRARSKT